MSERARNKLEQILKEHSLMTDEIEQLYDRIAAAEKVVEAASTLINMLTVLLPAGRFGHTDAHRLGILWTTDRDAAVAEFYDASKGGDDD